MLLRYVSDQSKQKKKVKKDDDDGKDAKFVRKWYTPWKKSKVEQQDKQVGRPSS